MTNIKIKIFSFGICALLSFPHPVLANRNLEIAKALDQTETETFAQSYIKDLRTKITEEKRETATETPGKFTLHQQGSIRNEVTYRISRPKEFTKIKNRLILAETGKLSDALNFKLSGRFYYDAVYDLTNNFPENVKSDQGWDAELRDTYIDYSTGPWDIRLGKQQIVWGEAVGVFFADVVNAKDLREYILPDFDLIRIPDWAVDLEYSKENAHMEFVWIPILQFDKLGVTGSEFTFPYPVPSGIPFTAQDPQKPKNSFDNSEVGCRLSYFVNGWDLGAFYLHSWDKFPVLYRSIDLSGFHFSPEYKRLDSMGSTFSKEINDIIFKGEFVFNRKGYFSIFDANNESGITQKDFIDYLLGMDYTFFGKIDTNFQFMQRAIFNYDKLMANDRAVHNSVSFWISKDFLNDKLKAEFLVIAGLTEPDFLYRPKLTYIFKNNWQLKFGADIFRGNATGLFGMFRNKSRIYSEILYNF